MKLYNSSLLKKIDEYAIEKCGIEGTELMLNAAKNVYDFILEKFSGNQDITIVCGKGNNAGDGYALYNLLSKDERFRVKIVRLFESKVTGDPLFYYKNIPSEAISFYDGSDFTMCIPVNSIIVDAIFGFGFHGDMDEKISMAVNYINNSRRIVISIDIPSGIECDTGKCINCIHADYTICLSALKPYCFTYPALEYSGEIMLCDIGIPENVYSLFDSSINAADDELAVSILKPRPKNSHKGTFGRIALICGSENMPGAAILASGGALRSGIGLTELLSYKSVCNIVSSFYPEVVHNHINSEDYDLNLSKYRAALIGCGLGFSDTSKNMFLNVIKSSCVIKVIDADALKLLKDFELFSQLNGDVLTPHPKEMAYLFNVDISVVLNSRFEYSLKLSEMTNSVVVLKGADTIITDGKSFYINKNGNSGMAKGGSGDVLSGIIVSLLGQGYSSLEAAVLGVYIHGLAGNFAAKKYGEHSMLPSDIINSLPDAFNYLYSKRDY